MVLAISQAAETLQQIRLLRPQSGSDINCFSWQLAVEANNHREWVVVPLACKNYVEKYILGDQYPKDCEFVAKEAAEYAKSLKLPGTGKDIWVFDIDETTLSNVLFYALPENAFGTKTTNSTSLYGWLNEESASPVPGMVKLYNQLYLMGIKFVFLTGRPESARNTTETNLKKAGYHTWEKLILRQPSEENLTALVYKSMRRKELEKNGYKIIGNMGDQWSDLLGTNVGNRTFKVPNPMYYIS